MASDPAERLAETCHERVGDNLRSVAAYSPDGLDPVYLRDDIRHMYSGESFARLVGKLTAVQAEIESADPESTPLGPNQANVFVFDGALVCQFPAGGSEGHMVSMEPHVGQMLDRFLSACRQSLH
ncbi:MAG: hypothetical protein ABEJ79_02595 [Halolamina sp.]